jgi:hypothetical protein
VGVLVRRSTTIVTACLFALAGSAAAQSPAPDGSAPGSLCLLTLDELTQLSGLRFVRTAAGPANCTYDGDPAEDLYTLDLRLVPPETTVSEPIEDGLLVVRSQYDDGRDTTVTGFPAWESSEGVWVDLGRDVFVAQPILFFMAEPPDATTFLVPLAELAISRLPGEAS